ncbi:hypothetical protein ABVK32_28725, partial [Mycobacterium kansasii]
NTGLLNTGVGNAGSYNSGSFNVGASNTGSWNAGDTNTGWFNPGDVNTGIGNTGDVNTGGFNQGNLNNGFFWRGDGQGHAGFDYTLTIPAIGLNLGADVPLGIPVTGTIGTIVNGGPPEITVPGFTIPTLHLTGDALFGTIGPIVVDPITITGPSLNLTVGGGQSLQLGFSGPGVGPVVIPVLQVAAGPGVGNSTGVPSSGFFNSGVGGASGFGNVGGGSGWWNVGRSSGVGNVGVLGSGVLNLGDGVSGWFNTVPSMGSGVGNVGEQLAGLFSAGPGGPSVFNLGLGNQG